MSSLEKIAKACAFVIFADGKIDKAEIDSAKALLKKYGFDENEGEILLKKELDAFIDESEEEQNDSEEILLGNLTLEDIDSFEILKDLALIAAADVNVSINEIDIIHSLAEAFELDPRFASMAILNAVKNNPAVNITLE